MRDYDEFLEERKPIYVDIYQKLWNTIGSHETLWFIWFNMVTIVKAVEDTPYQGDILGGQMSRYGWSERTPFWCWDLLYLNDDEHFEDIKSMLQYRKLVEDLKEAGTYSSAGIIWQQIIDRNDIDEMVRIVIALDRLALEFIPNTVNDICDNWSKDDKLKPIFFPKMKKIAIAEQKKTLKLSALIKSSIKFFPEL